MNVQHAAATCTPPSGPPHASLGWCPKRYQDVEEIFLHPTHAHSLPQFSAPTGPGTWAVHWRICKSQLGFWLCFWNTMGLGQMAFGSFPQQKQTCHQFLGIVCNCHGNRNLGTAAGHQENSGFLWQHCLCRNPQCQIFQVQLLCRLDEETHPHVFVFPVVRNSKTHPWKVEHQSGPLEQTEIPGISPQVPNNAVNPATSGPFPVASVLAHIDQLGSLSLRHTTRNRYMNDLAHFHNLMEQYGLYPALTVKNVEFAIATWSLQGRKHDYIASKITALRYFLRCKEVVAPLWSPRITQLLRGVQNIAPHTPAPDPRLAVTEDILNQFLVFLPSLHKEYFCKAYEAMFRLAQYCMLRPSEYTVTSVIATNNTIALYQHCLQYNSLTWSDDAVTLTFASAKCRLPSQPFKLVFPWKLPNPVHNALVKFLAIWVRGIPFFTRPDGLGFCFAWVRKVFTTLAQKAGYDPIRYTLHALRMGGATERLVRVLSCFEVMQLGRWCAEDTAIRYFRPGKHALDPEVFFRLVNEINAARRSGHRTGMVTKNLVEKYNQSLK